MEEPQSNIAQRWNAAQDQSITRESARALLKDPSSHIARALATNYGVEQEILSMLAELHPEVRSLVALNVNAPPYLKDEAPIWRHVESALRQYALDKNATDAQRIALRQEYVASLKERDDSLLLRAVWEVVRTR